jgi:hypothetical protein
MIQDSRGVSLCVEVDYVAGRRSEPGFELGEPGVVAGEEEVVVGDVEAVLVDDGERVGTVNLRVDDRLEKRKSSRRVPAWAWLIT